MTDSQLLRPSSPQAQLVDCLKGVAILMVFAIHSSETVLVPTTVLNLEWYLALATNVLSRICVPWFVIISGFLLLDENKSRSFRDFYSRRLQRLLLPFAFWVVVYIAWRLTRYPERPTAIGWLNEVVSGPVYYHLWFLYMLFGMYLAAPFLARMLTVLGDREVMLFIAIWFVMASLGPWIRWVLKAEIGIPAGIFGSYFGYFVFGGWIKRKTVCLTTVAWCRRTAFVLLALTLVLSAWICRRDQDFNQVFLVYLAPNIVLLSLTSSIWATNGGSFKLLCSLGSVSRLLGTLGRRSFALYACHIMVLQLIDGWLPELAFLYPFRFAVVGIATLAITFAVMELPARTPYLNRLTG